MATEGKFLFNVAVSKCTDRDRPSVPMAQVQPHPKGLDSTKRIRASWILPDCADDFCATCAASIGKSFVKAKLPHVFADGVMLLG